MDSQSPPAMPENAKPALDGAGIANKTENRWGRCAEQTLFALPSQAAGLPVVTITTDGSCLDISRGPSGWAVVLRHGRHCRELSGHIVVATANRAELTAIFEGLKALRSPCAVTVRTDSMVSVWGIRNGLKLRLGLKREVPANFDLVEPICALCEVHSVEFVWIRSHSGDADNERCDHLAKSAARRREAA
jgi:ribonuclease HI